MDARARDNATALLVAASSGYLDIVKLLIERGADVKLQDDHGDTALMAAVRAGSLPSVKALLGAGADVNRNDKADRGLLTGGEQALRKEIATTALA